MITTHDYIVQYNQRVSWNSLTQEGEYRLIEVSILRATSILQARQLAARYITTQHPGFRGHYMRMYRLDKDLGRILCG